MILHFAHRGLIDALTFIVVDLLQSLGERQALT